MIRNWLELNREWLIPLGSSIVVISAFFALLRWLIGSLSGAKRLRVENDDALASIIINHLKSMPDDMRRELPNDSSAVTWDKLQEFKSKFENRLRTERRGTYQEIRDGLARRRDQRIKWFLTGVAIVMIVLLVVATWVVGGSSG